LQASLYLTLKTCENISLRAADALMFPMTKQSLMQSISRYNVGTLEELSKLNIHDFGIFLELEPDEEEKQILEQNIQIALKAGQIDLEDAIDIREVNNLKLANQMLKKRRKDKAARDQQAQQANIQAQAQANAKTTEAAALAETQKQQVLTEQKMQLEKAKSDFEIQKMEREAQVKQQLMELEFNYNMQLTQAQGRAKIDEEKFKEDRKDERTKIQATQQSELIDQRKNDLLPKNFESAGNDTMGGFGLEQFEPR
jgi:DNA polymerase III gamma/tau subunit